MKNFFLVLIKYYFPVFLWMGVIFFFSSIPGLRYSPNDMEEVILRKGAHFTEYFILTILFFRIFYAERKYSFLLSICCSLLTLGIFSASDELHQSFVAGRTGKWEDVFYDIFSGFLALEILFFFKIKKRKFIKLALIFLTIFSLAILEIQMIKKAGGEKSFKNTLQEIENWPETIEKNINPKKDIIEEKEKTQKNVENKVFSKDEEEKNISEMKNDFIAELPEEIILEVPFTSQAPLFVWDEIHEEACEEATLVMMKYYLDGKKLDPKISENEIQNIVKYQIKKYGDYKDTDLKKTADIFLDYYGNGENYKGKKMKVIYDIKKEDLKKHLVQGNPTIVPTAGRLLKNPNFKSPGPLYHNLILIGYKNEKIIVNDPGTKKGEKYEYSIDILFEAIHDFPGKAEDIKKGRKAMIILE